MVGEKILIVWVRKYQKGSDSVGKSHRRLPRDVALEDDIFCYIVIIRVKREENHPIYLLSDHVWIMARLNFENTVISP